MTKVIQANQGLVQRWARRFASVAPMEDLVQEGNLGLLRAIEKYDAKRSDTNWSSYATWWIRAFIGRFVEKQNIVVKWRKGTPGIQEYVPKSSLDAPRGPDSDDTWLDSLPGAECPANEQLERHQLRLQVRGVVARLALSELARAIVERRLLSEQPATLDDISKSFGLSKQRVGQVETRTRALLARHLAPINEELAHG